MGRACATCCDARRTFLADEQGLGKTVEALAAIEADGAFPAVVVCPASLKLNWERETAQWLPHRSVAVVEGAPAVPPTGEITILNYEIVAAHREALARLRPRALVHRRVALRARTRRPSARARCAGSPTRSPPDGLRLALTGTPVLEPRRGARSRSCACIGRLEEFGSGAQFARSSAAS